MPKLRAAPQMMLSIYFEGNDGMLIAHWPDLWRRHQGFMLANAAEAISRSSEDRSCVEDGEDSEGSVEAGPEGSVEAKATGIGAGWGRAEAGPESSIEAKATGIGAGWGRAEAGPEGSMEAKATGEGAGRGRAEADPEGSVEAGAQLAK
jgi:hypothetical protein